MDAQLKSQIVEYSIKNAYVAEHFATARCGECGCETFSMIMNENEGVAARICKSCDSEHGIGNSDDFIDGVDEVYPIECSCGASHFKVMAGVALYDGSDDVRWFYLGCKCVVCGLSGVYGDWKNEFIGYRNLLNQV